MAKQRFETHSSEFICKVLKPSELTLEDMRDWKALQFSDMQYSTPLLSPEFAKMISLDRDDVRCIVVRESGQLVGVLAVHDCGFGFIRPVGTPFSDYAGPIIAKGNTLTLEQILLLSGFSAFRSDASIVRPDDVTGDLCEKNTDKVVRSFIIDLGDMSAEACLEHHRSTHPKRFKNFRRLNNKITLECGEIEFVFGSPKDTSVKQLTHWKSEQFKREGFLDLTTAKNTRQILNHVINADFDTENGLAPFMVGLKINGELVVGHYGIRDDQHFHPWISAYDPTYQLYSPGLLLLYKIIEQMDSMNLKTYDLSGGHESYKKYFCDGARFTQSVNICQPTFLGRLHKYSYESWNLIGAKNTLSPAARMRRRFDHIAVSESNLTARLRQILIAFRRRSVGHES